ncbi:MAG: zinc ribbon domain-containing protein [Candidatus Hodarchaeales archaeon]
MMELVENLLYEADEGHMFDEAGMMFGGDWLMWLMMLSGILIVLFLTIWTYQDAIKIGENAILWSLVVFLTMGIGIIVYALIRNPNRVDETRYDAVSSRNPEPIIRSETVFTPKKSLKTQRALFCENCGSSLELNDRFCPKCGNAVK